MGAYPGLEAGLGHGVPIVACVDKGTASTPADGILLSPVVTFRVEMDVLVFHDLPIADEIGDRRPDLEVHTVEDTAETRERLGEADVFVTNIHRWDDALLDGLSSGDLIQSTSAGYAAFPVETLDERGIALCTAAGVTAPTVSEHAFALALSFSRRLPVYASRQRDRVWDRSDSRTLSDWAGETLTVVGLGNIGERVARRGLGFDMTVHGVKRDPDAYDGCLDADAVFPSTELSSVLPETDLLVLAVPLTDETRGLIDEAALDALPDSAVLVNVCRGPVVEEAALLDALDAGRLGGAGLDVFDEEPLPPESPLWDHERVILTSHVAGRSDAFVPRFVDLLLSNLDHRAAGEPLENQLTGP